MYITHTHLHQSFCSYRVYSPLSDTQLKDNILPSSAKTGHYCSVTRALPCKDPMSLCLSAGGLVNSFYPPNSSPCWHWQKLHTIQIISQPSSYQGFSCFSVFESEPTERPVHSWTDMEMQFAVSVYSLCRRSSQCDSVYVIQYDSARPVLFCFFGSAYAPPSKILELIDD